MQGLNNVKNSNSCQFWQHRQCGRDGVDAKDTTGTLEDGAVAALEWLLAHLTACEMTGGTRDIFPMLKVTLPSDNKQTKSNVKLQLFDNLGDKLSNEDLKDNNDFPFGCHFSCKEQMLDNDNLEGNNDNV